MGSRNVHDSPVDMFTRQTCMVYGNRSICLTHRMPRKFKEVNYLGVTTFIMPLENQTKPDW
jgi:hypothetical protein